ncbi:hypothetical protein BGZ58_010643 [Dissophora ornata]|nr:hypothetical protein BGZ58_010643 [Dissophora ornata]
MGKAHKSRMDDDFSALQDETDAKRAPLEKLHETSQAYLKALSKRVEGDDKYKGLAIETFGMSMTAQANVLREGSGYREALQQMGEAHQSIGTAQVELIGQFANSYIDCLEREQAQMKEYHTLQKKLHSRRLDYDSKLAKVQKAKKEKPEWEEEMQASKAKYEETRECVLGVMTTIYESQDENVHCLKSYYDAQLAFARKMVEVLEAIPESIFVTSSNGSFTSLNAERSRKTSSQNSEEHESDHANNSDDNSSMHSVSADIRRHTAAVASHLSPNTSPSWKASAGFGKADGVTTPSAPPPPLPNRGKPQQKQVRALYNFEATAEGELSFHKGNIVRIIEEIDEGWWEGELVDEHGVRHEGMFPSNYVEEVAGDSEYDQQHSPVKSNTPVPVHYADEEEAAYYERPSESTDYDDNPEPEPVNVPLARRAPPPPPPATTHVSGASTVAPMFAKATPPPSRPSSGMASLSKPVVGSRLPPPPPASRRAGGDSLRHSVVFNQASSTQPFSISPPAAPSALGGVGAVGTPTGMGGYIPKDYFANQQASGATEMGPCRECQCTDFRLNVFKRGSCNNCFHTH